MVEPRGMRSVVIVEDSFFICKLLASSFLDHGFQLIAIARTGQEALMHLANFKPNLVTLDLVLPDGYGTELYDRIAAMHPQLPILIITDQRHIEAFETSQRLGAAGFLPKPFKDSDLQKVLQRIGLGAGG
jgi:two-component system chemotaxis response regulator CheY